MTFSQLLELYRHMGPLRFSVFMVGLFGMVLGWALLGWWLGEQVGWPERYGFACHGRGCMIDYLSHSLALLVRGSSIEMALFAYLWLIPTVLAAAMVAALFIAVRRWHRVWRNRIRPLRPD